MQGQIQKDHSSGIVSVKDDKLFWDLNDKNILEVGINDIVVIGEYTNAEGPFFDDWFLTFVTRDGQWHSVSWYAENIEQVTQYLSNKFHPNLSVSHLMNSTGWKSLVRYPLHLEDQPLFILVPSDSFKAPKTVIDKIFFSIGIGAFDTTKIMLLAQEVTNEVQNASR
jgi:hypothetical protein